MRNEYYDENRYYDDDGSRVPPQEVRRRRAYYESMDTETLQKMFDEMPLLGGDDGLMVQGILLERRR